MIWFSKMQEYKLKLSSVTCNAVPHKLQWNYPWRHRKRPKKKHCIIMDNSQTLADTLLRTSPHPSSPWRDEGEDCFHSLELWPYKPNYVFPSNPPTSPLKNKLLVKSLELPQARPATPLHMKCVRPAHFVTIQRTALMKFAKGPYLKGERREICPGWVSAGAL